MFFSKIINHLLLTEVIRQSKIKCWFMKVCNNITIIVEDLFKTACSILVVSAGISKSKRKQHPTKQKSYNHLPPISQTIQVRQAKHTGEGQIYKQHSFLWIPPYEHTHIGQPAKTNILQLCINTGGCLEYLQSVMVNRDRWQKRVKRSHDASML